MDRPEKDTDLACEVTSPKHQRKHHDLHRNRCRRFTCLLCNNVYLRSQNARRHILNSHSHVETDEVNKYMLAEKDFDLSCKDCHKTFTSPYHQRKHLDNHKNRYRAFNCLLCNNVYEQSCSARRHILKFHSYVGTDNVNEYVGREGNEPVGKEGDEAVGREGDEPVDEDDDGMRYMLADSEEDTEDEEDIEQNASAIAKSLTCELCDKTSGSTSYMQRHRREIHGLYERKKKTCVPCDLCDKAFGCKRYMQKHQRLVHGIYMRKKKTEEVSEEKDDDDTDGGDETENEEDMHVQGNESSEEQASNGESHEKKNDDEYEVKDRKTVGNVSVSACDLRGKRKIHMRLNNGIYTKKRKVTPGDDDTENEEEMHVEQYESLEEQASVGKIFEKKSDTEVEDRQNLGVDSALTCDQCGKTYRNKILKNRHRREVHGLYVEKKTDSLLECDQCGKIYRTKISKNRHRREVHGLYVEKKTDSALDCDQCGKIFKNRKTKYKHRRKIHGLYVNKKAEESYNKKIEERSKKDKEDLEQSESEKKNDDEYKVKDRQTLGCVSVLACDQCGKMFPRKRYLNKHRRSVHGIYIREAYMRKKKSKENPEKTVDDDTEGDEDNENEEEMHVDPNESLEEQASEWENLEEKNDDETKVNRDESREYETKDLFGRVVGSSDAFEMQGKLYSHTKSLKKQRRQVHRFYLKEKKEEDTYVDETEYGFQIEHIRKEDLIPDGSAITCDICGKQYNGKKSLQTHRRKIHGVYATDRRKIHEETIEQSCASDEVDASNVIRLAPQPSVSADTTLVTLAHTTKSPVTKEFVKCVKQKNEKTESPEQDSFMVTSLYGDSSTCAERRMSLSPQKSDPIQRYKHAANKYKSYLTMSKIITSPFSLHAGYSSSADADSSSAAIVTMQPHESSGGFHRSALLCGEMTPAKETFPEGFSPHPQACETGEILPQKSKVSIAKSTNSPIKTKKVTNPTVHETFTLVKPTVRSAKEIFSQAKVESSIPSRKVALEKIRKFENVLTREEQKVFISSKDVSETNNSGVVIKPDDNTDTSGGLKKSLRQCLEEKISLLPTSELLKTFMPVKPLINAAFVKEGTKTNQKIVQTSLKRDGHSPIALFALKKSEKKSSSQESQTTEAAKPKSIVCHPQNQDEQVKAESDTQKFETNPDTTLMTNTAPVDSLSSKCKSSPLKPTNKDLIQRRPRKKRDFNCTMCELACVWQENLISHMKSTHPPPNLPCNLGNLEQENVSVDIRNDCIVTGETKSIEKSRIIESTQKELFNDQSTLDVSCYTEGNKYPNDLVRWKLGNIPSKLKHTTESQIMGSVVCVKKLQQNLDCLETQNLTLYPVRNGVWKVQASDLSASSITSGHVAEREIGYSKHDTQEVIDLTQSDIGRSKNCVQEVADVTESDMGSSKHDAQEVIDLTQSDIGRSKNCVQEVADIAESDMGSSKYDAQEVSSVLDETDGTLIQIIGTSKVDPNTLEEHIGKEDLLEEMLADVELVYELDETDGTFKEVVRKKQTSDEDLLERMDDSLAKEILSDSVAVIDFEKKLVNMDLQKGDTIGNDELHVIGMNFRSETRDLHFP